MNMLLISFTINLFYTYKCMTFDPNVFFLFIYIYLIRDMLGLHVDEALKRKKTKFGCVKLHFCPIFLIHVLF